MLTGRTHITLVTTAQKNNTSKNVATTCTWATCTWRGPDITKSCHLQCSQYKLLNKLLNSCKVLVWYERVKNWPDECLLNCPETHQTLLGRPTTESVQLERCPKFKIITLKRSVLSFLGVAYSLSLTSGSPLFSGWAACTAHPTGPAHHQSVATREARAMHSQLILCCEGNDARECYQNTRHFLKCQTLGFFPTAFVGAICLLCDDHFLLLPAEFRVQKNDFQVSSTCTQG